MMGSEGDVNMLAQADKCLRKLNPKLHRLTPEHGDTGGLDALYTFPCGVLGVQHYGDWDQLAEGWLEAQHRLGSTMRSWPFKGPRAGDAYLLMVVDQDATEGVPLREQEGLLREIRTSRSECLKEVVISCEGGMLNALRDLSFAPIPEPKAALEAGQIAVSHLLTEAGLPLALIEHMQLTRPGVKSLAGDIEAGAYGTAPVGSVTTEATAAHMDQSAKARTTVRRASTIQLRSLVLDHFRSFRGGRQDEGARLEFSPGITVVYGANATGKTCLVQALEWAISGTVTDLERCVQNEETPSLRTLPLRHLSAGDAPARVKLETSDGRVLHRTTGPQGDWIIEDGRGLDDSAIWKDWLGIEPLAHERSENRRGRCSALLFLSQGGMQRILSAKTPEERLDEFAALLGDMGLVRTSNKIGAVAKEMQRRHLRAEGQLQVLLQRASELEEECAALRQQLEDAEDVGPVHDPSRFLQVVSEHRGGTAPTADGIDGQDDGQVLMITVERAVSQLEAEHRSLTEDIRQAEHRSQLEREFAQAEQQTARAKEEVSTAERNRLTVVEELSRARQHAAGLNSEVQRVRDKLTECTERVEHLEWWSREQSVAALLSRRVVDIDERLPELVRHRGELVSERDRISAVVEALRQATKADEGRLEATRERLTVLKQLAVFFERHPDLPERIRLSAGRRDKAHAEVQAATHEVDVLREKKMGRERHVQRLRELWETALSQRDRRRSLLTQVAEMVEGAACPLCSHEWASPNELRLAVETQLGAETVAEAKVLGDLKEAEAELETVHEEVAAAEEELHRHQSALGEVTARLNSLRQAADELSQLLDRVDLHRDAIHRDVLDEIERWQELTETARSQLDQLRARVGKAQQAMELQEGLVRQADNAMGNLREEEAQVERDLTQFRERVKASKWLPPAEGTPTDGELARAQAEAREVSENLERLQEDCASAEVAIREATLREAETAETLAAVRAALNETESRSAELASELSLLLVGTDHPDVAEDISSLRGAIGRVEELLIIGRQAWAATQRQSLAHDLGEADKRWEECQRQIGDHQAVAGENSRWCEVLVRSSDLLSRERRHMVTEGLQPLRELMRRIHARIAWHPLFGEIDWDVDETGLRFYAYGRRDNGSDPDQSKVIVQGYMNEAQQNIIALSAFLAQALSRGGELRMAVLDDPVQAMDELNVYGMLDLLRVLSEHMQIVLTTGRSELFQLARAKFSCLNRPGGSGFRAYQLHWDTADATTRVEEVRG